LLGAIIAAVALRQFLSERGIDDHTVRGASFITAGALAGVLVWTRLRT
jgi:hypothetical protein